MALRQQLKSTLLMFVLLTLLTGVLYPLSVTALGQLLFKGNANGNLDLIGQNFTDPRYFWGRLSATSGSPYNASASSGSNLGPSNPALLDAVKARIKALKAADPGNTTLIPIDLVTASGSGLDPQISLAGANYQAPRVARLRGLSEDKIEALIAENTEPRFLGVLGEPAVNVLKLNRDLDAASKSP
jgi:potassium-transporting ATPase KdpC subunit